MVKSINETIMIDLNKEAEEYAEKHGFRIPYDGSNKFYDDNDVKWSKEGFISGDSSKFVKQQILQAQIDTLSTLKLGINDANTVTIFEIKDKIYQLQQKLKQL